MADPEAPFDSYRAIVLPEWIDENDHLNVGYYGVVFDDATEAWLIWVGLDPTYRETHAATTFTLESRMTYQREVVEGEKLRFTTQLLGWDQKRIHYFHRMFRESDGELSATNELVTLHVDQRTRRASPMQPEAQERLTAIERTHRELPLPPEVSRPMGLGPRG